MQVFLVSKKTLVLQDHNLVGLDLSSILAIWFTRQVKRALLCQDYTNTIAYNFGCSYQTNFCYNACLLANTLVDWSFFGELCWL